MIEDNVFSSEYNFPLTNGIEKSKVGSGNIPIGCCSPEYLFIDNFY